jgi:hypothetical protein
MKAWLDVSVLRCPKCRRFYIDASWYVAEMEADIECGECKEEFNSRRNIVDRALLEFDLDEKGKIENVTIAKHLEIKNNISDNSFIL